MDNNRKRKLSELYSEPTQFNIEEINNIQQINHLKYKIQQLENEINFYKKILQPTDYTIHYIS